MISLESICTFEALYRSYQQTKRGKRYKTEVIMFEENLSIELIKLQEELLTGTYHMSPYISFYVYEPKKRIVFACSYRDRVVLRWLCDYLLSPLISPKVIYDNAACQLDKGPQFSRERLKKHLSVFSNTTHSKGFALVSDISHFFASINQSILKQQLNLLIQDTPLNLLINHIVDSFKEQESGKGLPLGNQTSQLFSLLYLHSLDIYIKEHLKIKAYVRYMDDFILIHPSKTYLEECYDKIKDFLKFQLDLKFNPKTKIVSLRSGISYLGYRFYTTQYKKCVVTLKQASKKRLHRQLKEKNNLFYIGDISSKELITYLLSLEEAYSQGQTYSLMKQLYHPIVFEKRNS